MSFGSGGAAGLIPSQRGVSALREAAADCRACPLWRGATQTVFGVGPARASIVLVGEQPGDQEDRVGKPFVGPAGKLLGKALAEAGIEPGEIYLTNAVKHFKFELRGKRRIHQKPSRSEVKACAPWLEAELGRIKPGVVGLLGATAAQSVMGPGFKVTEQRGGLLTVDFAEAAVATLHPSAILRSKGRDREQAYGWLVEDLAVMAKAGRLGR
jgi:uracil-DNA glycosylase family protein